MKKMRKKGFSCVPLTPEVAELLHIYEKFITFVPSK